MKREKIKYKKQEQQRTHELNSELSIFEQSVCREIKKYKNKARNRADFERNILCLAFRDSFLDTDHTMGVWNSSINL